MALDNIIETYIKDEGIFEDMVNEMTISLENNIRQKTPYNTGLLRSSIRTESSVSGLEAVITGMWDEGTAPYGIYVHEGTSPHDIYAKPGSALNTPYGLFKHVHHPGNKARPFLDEGLESFIANDLDRIIGMYGG